LKGIWIINGKENFIYRGREEEKKYGMINVKKYNSGVRGKANVDKNELLLYFLLIIVNAVFSNG
jgi:hypothetical protein